MTDPIYTLGWLYMGGAEPPAPGPATCGPDTTPSKDITVPCVYSKCP